jgi:hypothetical protein
VLIRQEVGRWLSDAILAECLIEEVLDMLVVEGLEELILSGDLLLNGLD